MSTTALQTETTGTAPAAPRRKLAYLLSGYPAISHTFFLNEILALRKLGFDIDVASINSPKVPPGGLPVRESVEMETTFYVKSIPKLRAAFAVLRLLFLRPEVVYRGLKFALSLNPWNLRAGIYSLFYLVEALIVGDWMRRRGMRHLHIHFGGPVASVGIITSVAWGVPYSLMIHGPEEFFDVSKTNLVEKASHASFVLCISDFCRSQLMRILPPEQWSKLHVVRLGVDPDRFKPVPRKVRSETLEILCVGRLVPDKGQLVLLQAFSELIARGHSLRLRFVGEGPDRSRLEAFIAQRNLSSQVILEGALNHDETRQRLVHADIFVLPSFAEGVPVALMEAMAMEVPCISTYVAGIPELIENGTSGILVSPSSSEALAQALEELIQNEERRQQLGAAGRARVLERYNLPVNIGTLATVLESRVGQ